MGGGCPNLLSTFHKLYILGPFGDGEGGGDPCPIFFGTLAFKKSGTSCPNWGEGRGQGNLDKIQKNSYIFFLKPSLRANDNDKYLI